MFKFFRKSKFQLTPEIIDEVETELIAADLGSEFTAHVVELLKEQKFKTEVSLQDLQAFVAERIENFLKGYEKKLQLGHSKPQVILTFGANGSGKTTTLAKLGNHFTLRGKKCLLVAADTFRAGAVEQLDTMGHRLGLEVFSNPSTTDAAAIAYQACEYAKSNGHDIVLIDTSGRLTNNTNLMFELKKINSVIKKLDPNWPHESLLVLDGTIGQAAIMIAEGFMKAVKITGLIITKLDGSSKGGALLPLCHQLKVPVAYLGLGESATDLAEFKAADFAHRLTSGFSG